MSPLSRAWPWAGALLLLLSLIALIGALSRSPASWLDSGDKIAGIASLAVGLLSLMVSLLALRLRPTRDSDAQLAALVRRQWAAEAALRLLDRPTPLRVRWASAHPDISASAADILAGIVPGRPTALRIAGDASDLADALLRLPLRQLVLIGQPGAGKSMMLLSLTLELLNRRRPGDNVPVLLAVSTWARGETLDAWLIRRLREDYPSLGREAAADLVTTGMIFPLLDGLDELPLNRHTEVFEFINSAFASGGAFMATCRSDDFDRMVRSSGTPLARAAVIELQDIRPADVMSYLTAAQLLGAERWSPVAAELHRDPDGPLARTLAIPLNVYLARAIYGQPSRDPATLAILARESRPDSVERHLLDGYAPALYPDGRGERYIRMLAQHLDRVGGQDITWWGLKDAVDHWPIISGMAYMITIAACSLINWLPSSLGLIYIPAWSPLQLIGLAIVGGYSTSLNESSRVETSTQYDGRRDMAILGVTAFVSLSLILREEDLSPWAHYGTVLTFGMCVGYLVGMHISGPAPSFYILLTALICLYAPVLYDDEVSVGVSIYIAILNISCLILARVFTLYPGRRRLTHKVTISERFGPAIAAGLIVGSNSAADLMHGAQGWSPLAAIVIASHFGIPAFCALIILKARSDDTPWAKIATRVTLAGILTSAAILASEFTYSYAGADDFGKVLIEVLVVSLTGSAIIYLISAVASGVGMSNNDLPVTMTRSGLKRDRLVVAATLAALVVGSHIPSIFGTSEYLYHQNLVGALVILHGSRWPQFALARFALSASGRVPWRLLHFLDDAHRRGVLRQIGGVYQFRHERLRSHLAAMPPK